MQIGSPEALKAQMEKCIVSDCKDRPYTDAQICDTAMTKDALEYIESLEERIAIKDEALEALEQRCNALEALEQRCKVLEEQEQPKSVYDPRLCNNSPKAYKGFCPWCNSVITLIHGKFCDKCGKAVKWK